MLRQKSWILPSNPKMLKIIHENNIIRRSLKYKVPKKKHLSVSTSTLKLKTSSFCGDQT